VEPDVLIAVFAVVVSIFGLALTGLIAWRQWELTKELARRQEVGVVQWRSDLRVWAFEAINVMSEASYACAAMPEGASPKEYFRQYLHRNWALIDRGRLFLPNQHPEARKEDPVIAYRGYRHKALDPLWAEGIVLEDRIEADLRDDVTRYRRYVLEELQREFVSNISSVLALEHHNKAIAQIIQDSERTIKEDSARASKQGSEPEETPIGDKALLRIVVPRVADRQKRRGNK
jgi:hypothetical protein